jgi:outer membrane protein assembly factor BamB
VSRAALLMPVFLSAACGQAPADDAPDRPAPLAAPAPTDWPGFLGPAGNGASAETGLADKWPADGPPVIFRLETGDSYAAPSVARGVLVSFHRLESREVVDAHDAKTGKRFWRFAYATDYADRYGAGEGPRSTPLIAGDRVYVLGPGGVMHALELASGAFAWKRNLKADFDVPDNFFGVGTSPVIDDGVLMLNVGGPEAGIVGLDPATGKTLWTATKDAAGYSTPVCATLHGRRLAFFLTRAGAVCLEPKTGRVRWAIPFRARINASVNAATPVVVGESVFFSASYGTGGMLVRVAPDGGHKVLWRNDALSCHFATPLALGGHLYGFDGRYDGPAANLRCIDLKTGVPVWKDDNFGQASMIAADGKVFLRMGDKVVLARITEKGIEELSSASLLKSPAWTAPVLSDGRLYVRDQNTILCLDVRAKR